MVSTSAAVFDVNDAEFDIKAVLQSTDIDRIRSTVTQFAELELKDDVQIEQNFKVQILLWNRMLALYEQLKSKDDSTRKEQVQCYHTVSKLWANLEDRPRAIAQLHRAMEVFPQSDRDNETTVDTLQFLGETYLDSGDFGMAIEYHRRAIEMLMNIGSSKGQLAMAYGELAAAYESQGEFDEAVKTLKTALQQVRQIEVEDGSGEDYFAGDSEIDDSMNVKEAIYCQLGSLYYKMGAYGEAVAALTSAVQLLACVRGKDNPKTKEYAYMLEMSSSLAE